MYRYDEFDERFVRERVAQFRNQVERRLDGSLSDDEFKPLRLKNGLYLQLHAYMLRIAVPYGTLSSRQLRQLAVIAERFDKGYGHFTTRQNIQFNWPKLKDVPDILDLLADVEMHCIQTSGNCIRNVTADQFSGVAADEVEDPRPTAELIRQWSSLHPEFSWLPRKFKIAVTGAEHDRAAILVHDIGLKVRRHPDTAEIGYEVVVGGGLGRTPMVGKVVRDFLPRPELLAYLEAIMRVYNAEGRRDNKYKARVKILVHEVGPEEFVRRVEAEYAQMNGPTVNAPVEEVERIAAYFAAPAYETLPGASAILAEARAADPGLDRFVEQNGFAHRVPGYIALTISLKPIGGIPGDMTHEQMRAFADIAERYSFDELRVTHAQNLVLPNVRLDDVPAVYAALKAAGLATSNAGLVTDIIACPGLDYCALATARSIGIAQEISTTFSDETRQKNIGPLQIKISGCINACGHHHVGHIGILGIEKSGKENYQITVGGDATEKAALGERLGPGIDGEDVPGAIEAIVAVYMSERQNGEEFIDTVRRAGLDPFKSGFQAYVAARTGEPVGRNGMTLLLTETGEKADRFTSVENVADLSLVSGLVIVPLTAIDQAIEDRRNEPLGLSIANDASVEAVRPYLGTVALISIAFPSFSDGRGLSLARRLRRVGFTGTLRASGPLIADQFAEALACGFDEVKLPDQMAARQPAAQWMVAKAIVEDHYQSGYGEGESILQKRLAARKGAAR